MTVKTYKELSLKQREQREGYLETDKEKAKKARLRTHSLIKEYHCNFCGLFHIGHVGRRY